MSEGKQILIVMATVFVLAFGLIYGAHEAAILLTRDAAPWTIMCNKAGEYSYTDQDGARVSSVYASPRDAAAALVKERNSKEWASLLSLTFERSSVEYLRGLAMKL